MMFSAVAALFYTSTNSVHGHNFLHILSDSYCLCSFPFGCFFFFFFLFFFFGNNILTSLKLYHIVWICIFLMISRVTFPIPVGRSYVFFGKMANQCSLPVFQYGLLLLLLLLSYSSIKKFNQVELMN